MACGLEAESHSAVICLLPAARHVEQAVDALALDQALDRLTVPPLLQRDRSREDAQFSICELGFSPIYSLDAQSSITQ